MKSQFEEYVKEDCEQFDIETKSKAEIDSLLKEWDK